MKLYGFLSLICFYLTLPFFYAERVFHKKSFGWKKKFGNVEYNHSGDKTIMLHACSVGEVNAIVNLAKEIKSQFQDYKLVITTSTKTGQDLAHKKFEGIADLVTYFPFDIYPCVNKFLDIIQPSIVLIAETEIWPNFAYGCKTRNIPVCVVNGRISDSTFKTYKLAKLFFKQAFKSFSAVYTQSHEDKDKYIAIGMSPENTEFMGNLKFDVDAPQHSIDLGQNGFKVLIAGSTHKGENEIILDVFAKIKNKVPELKLLIAPRHLERVCEIKELIEEKNINYGLRSQNDSFIAKDIIILDTLGELGKMYSACDIAFVGGSFNKTGGHNPLEAAIYYKPTISGPSIHNFKDIYYVLEKSKAGKVVNTAQELYSLINELLTNEQKRFEMSNNCEKVFTEQRGAIKFVISKVKEILKV